MALFRDYPGKLVLKQETVSGSGISWAICKTASRSRHIATPAPHHSVFYRPDALPATQPTASKHWRQVRSTDHNQKKSLTVKKGQGSPSAFLDQLPNSWHYGCCSLYAKYWLILKALLLTNLTVNLLGELCFQRVSRTNVFSQWIIWCLVSSCWSYGKCSHTTCLYKLYHWPPGIFPGWVGLLWIFCVLLYSFK